MTDLKTRLIQAAEPHVAFDGWGDVTFEAAIADSGVDATVARAIFPRGAVDLAVASHRLGDVRMVAAVQDADLSEMRFRDKVALAVKLRLQQCDDKEVVRRGTTLFALPQHGLTGSRLIWGTADAIWQALGDGSKDINWYTKRTTLSAVYASTVLFWLGDDSLDHADTWAFLDRRIDNVMQFEKAKAGFNKSALGKALSGPLSLLDRVRAPNSVDGFPGRWG
ncbi:MAG: COQ9 family protein [Cognatishimia sp.]